MRRAIHGLYRFLPVQLFLLHFRKYQMLLIFWIVVFLTVAGHFASRFGSDTLFLAPEYLGHISFWSMLLLGVATSMFTMVWHITTFIIHSKRIPFLGAARQSFLKYCINNSVLPLLFLIFYSVLTFRFQYRHEQASVSEILILLGGFFLGFLLGLLASFAYFFRVDRDLLKVVLSRITDPSRIRDIIPYDTLDYEFDLIKADTYLTETFRVERISELEKYHFRLLSTVLRRHHRNAVTATIFAFAILLILGIFMDEPLLRIPAGAGFLILFSVMMGVVGAVKYFLKSWELIGYVIFIFLVSWLAGRGAFDIRSIAYGLDYQTGVHQEPVYNYQSLRKLFTAQRYQDDRHMEKARLGRWLKKQPVAAEKPTVVIITVSGGGSRSAYWTFRALQYLDSTTNGALFNHAVMMSGASGGMIGASYWRAVHQAHQEGKIANPYADHYQQNIGKDLLNAIVFSFATVDLISPFNKISLAGYSYEKDRGYAMEQEMIRNTEGLLDRSFADLQPAEYNASMPAMVVNGTIVNDGRKLMMSPLPISYLTRPAFALNDTNGHPAIDAVDFGALFIGQDAQNLRLTTALRMNATFPYMLPVVRLPSRPAMNVMDAGLRDNFGTEVALRYVAAMRDWLQENAGEVVVLQIRDTREFEVFPPTEGNSLNSLLFDPLTVIQHKWEPFQSYFQNYLWDEGAALMGSRFHYLTLQYIPQQAEQAAALNFRLARREKADLYQSVFQPENQRVADSLKRLLSKE